MRKQKKIHFHFILMVVCCWFAQPAGAQTTIPENDLIYTYPASEAYIDLVIPSNVQKTHLYLEAKAGDGGESNRHDGGVGATAYAIFEIGSASNQIPPGSSIRLIPGKQGRSNSAEAGCCIGAGGGGGSGVLLLPAGKTDWEKSTMLMVAGGGGGGGSHGTGGGGNSSLNGSSGKTAGGNSLNNGSTTLNPGGSTGNSSGGASATKNAGPTTDDAIVNGSNWEHPGAEAGYPNGGYGASCVIHGGWGFGGGGSGNQGGGGGGGYSGGGGGDDHGGGGGGSYVNTKYLATYRYIQAGGSTGDPDNGYVSYGLVDLSSIEFAGNTNKCVASGNAGSTNDTNAQLADCTGKADQTWMIRDNRLRLVTNLSKCLELYNNNTANGTNVQLHTCNDSPGQKWIYDVYRKILRSGNDFNKCLDLVNGITTAGTNIQLYDCVSDEHQVNQQWVIDGVPSKMPGGSNKRIYLEKDRNKCVDIVNGSTANGANVQLNTCNSTNAQYLVFDNRYLRMQANTGKCLSLEDGGDANGNNIHLWDCKGQDNQKWVYDGFAKAFRSVVNINKCLSIEGDAGSEAPDGANIHLWDCKNNANQRFDIY